MNIIISCNIDAYEMDCFPKLSQVPRKGDLILVNNAFHNHYAKKKLPTILEVKQVMWGENDFVSVSVHYMQCTIDSAKLSGINLYP